MGKTRVPLIPTVLPSIKGLAREVTPPVIWRGFQALKRAVSPPPPPPPTYGYFGAYTSFDAAAAESAGYDADEAVAYAARETEKVRAAPNYLNARTARVLAALQYARTRLDLLHVLDFGGSLGGLYFATRELVRIDSWTVCDLPRMVAFGREHVLDERLRFTEVLAGAPTLSLASGALQYCRDPYQATTDLLAGTADFAIIDRLPLLDVERLTVQRVHPSVFAGSMPCWFLGREKFLAALAGWRVVMQWTLPEHLAALDDGLADVFHGFVLERHGSTL